MTYVWLVMHGYPSEGYSVMEIMEDEDFEWVMNRFLKRIEETQNTHFTGPESIELRSNGIRFFDGGWEWFSLERRAVITRR